LRIHTYKKGALLTAALAICSAAACSRTPTEPVTISGSDAARMDEATPPPSDSTAAARGIGTFGSGN
jgi:hypothetical protein